VGYTERQLKTILNYDKEALKRNIARAEDNIKMYEEAIAKEKQTITEYSFYISLIERNENKQ